MHTFFKRVCLVQQYMYLIYPLLLILTEKYSKIINKKFIKKIPNKPPLWLAKRHMLILTLEVHSPHTSHKTPCNPSHMIIL